MNRLCLLLFAGAMIVSISGANARAECPEIIPDRPAPGVLRDCFNEIPKIRNELRAARSRIEALEGVFGRVSILAVAAVRKKQLLSHSEGVIFDPPTGLISFPNPRGLPFIPLVSDFGDRNTTYITDTHYIQGVLGTDKFFVRAKALDTGGAERTADAHDFTVVVLGFQNSPKP